MRILEEGHSWKMTGSVAVRVNLEGGIRCLSALEVYTGR